MGNKSAKMTDADRFVADAIEQYPVLVFSKAYCPFCHKAKRAIADAAKPIADFPGAKVFELDEMGAQGRAIQSALASRTGRSTVPNVFIGGKNVGGGDETAALHRSKQLGPLLQRALAASPPASPPQQKVEEAPFNAKQFVADAVAAHPAVVFSKSYCPYCHAAKNAIAAAGQTVDGFPGAKVFELDAMGARGADIQNELAALTDRFTVPNVFIGGANVGGGDETSALHARGELATLLTRAVSGAAAAGSKSESAPAADADDADAEPSVDAMTFVKDAIATHPVLVFSKSYCPYCRAAKDAIADAGTHVADFAGAHVLELDDMGARGVEIQAALAELTGRTTVPNVFIGGVNVGGGDDVTGLAARNVLKQMLAQAPARLAGAGDDDDDDAATPAATMRVDPSSGSPRDAVDALITQAPVAVFSKSYCPYCKKARQLLADAGAGVAGYTDAVVVELDEEGMERGGAMQAYLAEKTGQTTVPSVFIEGKHIGGCDAVEALAKDGGLAPLLESAFQNRAAAAPPKPDAAAARLQRITLGAGCFWGVELAFQRVPGVTRTQVGYSNGAAGPLQYEEVCSGATGAAEVVRVTYDPDVVSLAALLRVWESRHDPTAVDRQGNDVGTQYRSAIFWETEDQTPDVDAWRADAEARGLRVATQVERVSRYNAAEAYHQRYLEKKGQSAAKGATDAIRCYG